MKDWHALLIGGAIMMTCDGWVSFAGLCWVVIAAIFAVLDKNKEAYNEIIGEASLPACAWRKTSETDEDSKEGNSK